MNNLERPFCLIKFGRKKHLESLLNKGELYFNNTEVFNKNKEINNEQGDENEGAEWIHNMEDVVIELSHPTLGDLKFKTIPNKTVKLTQFNHNYLTCSFYIITTKDFEGTNTLEIDKKMLEFGNYALVINNPKIFLDSLIESLESENIDYIARKVKYDDLSVKGKIKMNPFVKKIKHSHQREYRIVLKNQIEPIKLKLKGMESKTRIKLAYNKVLWLKNK